MLDTGTELIDLTGGYDLIKNKKGKMVTVFGSARTNPEDSVFKVVELLGMEIAMLGNTVMTGGGPGCMLAASKGAYEIGGNVLGAGINLPFEQDLNKYITYGYNFKNFHIRKKFLIYDADMIVCTPGGWGTVEEITEVLTLIQTKKIPKIPIYFLGKYYWRGMLDWFEETLYVNGNICEKDLDLYKVTDNIYDIIEELKSM